MPRLAPVDFAFVTTLTLPAEGSARNGFSWPAALGRQLAAAVGLDAAGHAGSYGSLPDDSPPSVQAGLTIRGFRKDEMTVSYAAFDPSTGRVLAWSFDLDDNPNLRSVVRLGLRDAARGRDVKLTEGLRARLAAVAGAKKTRGIRAAGTTSKPALFAHDKDVFGVAFSPDGRLLASTGFDAALRIWNAVDGTAVKAVRVAGGRGMASLHAVAFSPDGRYVATGARGIRRFDVATGTSSPAIEGHPEGEVRDICYSPSGRWIASISHRNVAHGDRSVALWDASTGRRRASIELGDRHGIRVRFADDEKTLYALTERPDFLIALELPMLAVRCESGFGTTAAVTELQLLRGRPAVAAGRRVEIFDPANLRRVGTIVPECLAKDDAEAFGFDASADGQWLAITAKPGVVIADETGRTIRALNAPGDRAAAAQTTRFSPDARRVVAAFETRLRTWDVASGITIAGAADDNT